MTAKATSEIQRADRRDPDQIRDQRLGHGDQGDQHHDRQHPRRSRRRLRRRLEEQVVAATKEIARNVNQCGSRHQPGRLEYHRGQSRRQRDRLGVVAGAVIGAATVVGIEPPQARGRQVPSRRCGPPERSGRIVPKSGNRFSDQDMRRWSTSGRAMPAVRTPSNDADIRSAPVQAPLRGRVYEANAFQRVAMRPARCLANVRDMNAMRRWRRRLVLT